MICESCGQNTATVHLTEITDMEKKELHLCDQCAESRGFSIKHSFSGVPPQISQIHAALKEMSSLMCPECGLTYAEFRSRGRLGCARDYSFFQRGLEPLLEKIHGGIGHVGKLPRRISATAELDLEIKNLSHNMSTAVLAEEYEKAAQIRDRIRELETRRKGPGSAQIGSR